MNNYAIISPTWVWIFDAERVRDSENEDVKAPGSRGFKELRDEEAEEFIAKVLAETAGKGMAHDS